jgi:hypothetical protein
VAGYGLHAKKVYWGLPQKIYLGDGSLREMHDLKPLKVELIKIGESR